ncbi:MAG: phosphate-starvation-inducible protein PsiE [Rhodomicrobium sp.]
MKECGGDEMKIEFGFLKIIHLMENIFLLMIALLTVIGVGRELYLIGVRLDIGLQDLLLMFLYVEVLAMVGAYYDSKQVPITLPIFIAITALARAIILHKDQDPLNLIYEAAAILMLALASVAVNYRPAKAMPAADREASKSSRDLRSGGL